jgi:hypothetical protein
VSHKPRALQKRTFRTSKKGREQARRRCPLPPIAARKRTSPNPPIAAHSCGSVWVCFFCTGFGLVQERGFAVQIRPRADEPSKPHRLQYASTIGRVRPVAVRRLHAPWMSEKRSLSRRSLGMQVELAKTASIASENHVGYSIVGKTCVTDACRKNAAVFDIVRRATELCQSAFDQWRSIKPGGQYLNGHFQDHFCPFRRRGPFWGLGA